MNKKVLGKGLGALLSSAESESADRGLIELKINEIEPNIDQPRRKFDDEKLLQLAESIRQHGVVQPIIVKKEEETYRIVAGERRWRAARIAGLTTVPVILKELSSKQVMEVALIENLQREDLNPIEEAEAFEKLMKEHKITQEAVSVTVGKSRSAVANSLRLLNLAKDVRRLLVSGEITSGHARTLLSIENEDQQLQAAQTIIDKELSVRESEKLVKDSLKVQEEKEKLVKEKDEILLDIEDRIKNILGTKVTISSNNNKGKIMIEYYSNDELDRLIEIFEKLGEKSDLQN